MTSSMKISSSASRIVDDKMISDYERDGVICVRQVIGQELVERLREAIPLMLDGPGAVGGEGRNRRAFNGWRRSDAYRTLVFDSPVARLAGELLNSDVVRLLYDHTIVKEPGAAEAATHWHHDLPFWPVKGQQICSIWIALDQVSEDSGAVKYARGSHRWPQRYGPGPSRSLDIMHTDLPAAPNLFEDPSADLIGWDMQPGDVLVFTPLTLHGAGGNRRADRARRAIVPRFLGEDVQFVEGKHVISDIFDPPVSLRTGDPLSGPNFPVVWQRT